MKGKLIKLVALFSSLLLMFSLVACGGDGDKKETTSATKADAAVTTEVNADEAEDASETKADADKDDKKTTKKSEKTTDKKSDDSTETKADSNNDNKNSGGSSTEPATATQKQSGEAPVDGSIAEIVEYYNKAANATKAKDDFSCTKKEVTAITIDSISNIKPDWLNTKAVKNLAMSVGNSVLERLAGKGETFEEKFVDGKPTIYELPKNNYFPIMESSKMSTLTASGVKSATCKKDGNGYVVTIVLKSEEGTNTKKPPAHAACVNYLRLEALNIEPFYVSKANMHYIDNTNSGTKIVAKVNKSNLLDYMNTYMTLKGSGSGGADLALGEISASAELHGTYTCEYKFKW